MRLGFGGRPFSHGKSHSSAVMNCTAMTAAIDGCKCGSINPGINFIFKLRIDCVGMGSSTASACQCADFQNLPSLTAIAVPCGCVAPCACAVNTVISAFSSQNAPKSLSQCSKNEASLRHHSRLSWEEEKWKLQLFYNLLWRWVCGPR